MKSTKYITYILFGISILLVVLFVLNIDKFSLENMAEALASRNLLDYVLFFAYVLMGISALCAVLMPVPAIFSNPKALKKILMTLVIVVVFIGISYMLASDAVPTVTVEESLIPTPGVVKTLDAGIILAYLMLAVALISMFGSGIYNSIRNR